MGIFVDQRIRVTKRYTYDVLDWLRDCGGLTKGLFVIGEIIIPIFTSYNLKTLLLTTFFRTVTSSHQQSVYTRYIPSGKN